MSLALPIACGDDDDDGPAPNPNVGGESNGGEPATNGGEPQMTNGGAGGEAPVMLPDGLSTKPSKMACGDVMCSSSPLLGGMYNVNPCCAAGDACGLATDFLDAATGGFDESCQPLAQPADTSDDSCPESASVVIPVGAAMAPLTALAGCCRAETGTCGYVLNAVDIMGIGPVGNLGLGCVDATPFLPAGDTAAPCGAAGGGSGGAGGGGGAGGESAGGASVGGGGAGPQ
jgi:hypothetical protein